MSTSTFKSLDSYTREDMEVFSTSEGYCYKLNGFTLNIIPPFQGLSVCRYMRWTASNAEVLCAFRA